MKRRKLTMVNDECRPGSLRCPTESTGRTAIGSIERKSNRFADENH